MIYSMTGYGRGEASDQGVRIVAEARTLNSRFFDFSFRSSRTLQNFEGELRELCRNRIPRGKLTLMLTDVRSGDSPAAPRIDAIAARRLSQELALLNSELGLQGGVTLDHLLHFPEVLMQIEDPDLNSLLLRLAREAAEAAMSDLRHMRQEEGAVLAADMLIRLSAIESALGDVAKMQTDVPARALEKLRERIKRLALPQAYDDYRIEMELAILVDRLDISEEIVRLRGHIEAFRRTLQAPEGVAGKRLEFLLQEMHRETNTIGSKTASLEISHLGVRMREEIERLREQVQNIE